MKPEPMPRDGISAAAGGRPGRRHAGHAAEEAAQFLGDLLRLRAAVVVVESLLARALDVMPTTAGPYFCTIAP